MSKLTPNPFKYAYLFTLPTFLKNRKRSNFPVNPHYVPSSKIDPKTYHDKKALSHDLSDFAMECIVADLVYWNIDFSICHKAYNVPPSPIESKSELKPPPLPPVNEPPVKKPFSGNRKIMATGAALISALALLLFARSYRHQEKVADSTAGAPSTVQTMETQPPKMSLPEQVPPQPVQPAVPENTVPPPPPPPPTTQAVTTVTPPATPSAPSAPPAGDTKTVARFVIKSTQKYVRIRKDPSTNKAPVASLKNGAEVQRLDAKGSWLKIGYLDAKNRKATGWIKVSSNTKVLKNGTVARKAAAQNGMTRHKKAASNSAAQTRKTVQKNGSKNRKAAVSGVKKAHKPKKTSHKKGTGTHG